MMYQKSELLKIIKKKYKIKIGMPISFKFIMQISLAENIDIKDLLCLLQINYHTWWCLKNGKRNYTKLKFNQFPEIKNKNLMGKTKINYEDFIKLKNEENLKDCTLSRFLGISRYFYHNMKNNKELKVPIKNIRKKHIVDLIRIDLKYLYGERYYSKTELKQICKKRNISLTIFLKYFHKNPKHYKLNKLVLEKNKYGLWIGESTPIANEIWDELEKKLTPKITGIAYTMHANWNYSDSVENLIRDALSQIYQKCGNIVKNFYFNDNLIYHILIKKGRFSMLNICRNDSSENKKAYYYKSNCKAKESPLPKEKRFHPEINLTSYDRYFPKSS